MTAIQRTRDLLRDLRLRVGYLRRGLLPDVRFVNQSFAQEGEDLVLRRVFERRGAGFYVDVGAHHPMRFSNTYIFYKAGWRGINIDATPGSMLPFAKSRPRDINLEIAISDEPRVLRYFTFYEPALNTFSDELAHSRESDSGYQKKATIEIRTERLADVLSRHLPNGQKIDFLTIDVEGWDLRVLRSNDWDRFRPEIVVAEALGKDLEAVGTSELVGFLLGKGYRLFAKTLNSVFLSV